MRGRLALVFQLVSLAFTGWILWGARLWSHGSRISFFDVLTRATAYALVAGAFGADECTSDVNLGSLGDGQAGHTRWD